MDIATVEAAAAQFGAQFLVRRRARSRRQSRSPRPRVRYAALERVRAEVGAAAVVGHTRDDQAETVLLNLLGEAAREDWLPWRPGRTYCADPARHAQSGYPRVLRSPPRPPVHDVMNDDRHFRHVAAARGHSLLETSADRDITEVLAAAGRDVSRRRRAPRRRQARLVAPEAVIVAADLAAAPVALARRAVRRWLGSPPPSFEQVESVLAVARGELGAVEIPGRRIERAAAGSMPSRCPPARRRAFALPRRATFGRVRARRLGRARRPSPGLTVGRSRCSTPTGSVRRSPLRHRDQAPGTDRSGDPVPSSWPRHCEKLGSRHPTGHHTRSCWMQPKTSAGSSVTVSAST